MLSSLKQMARSPLAQGVLKGGIFFLTLTLVACLLRFADASGLFDASFLNDYVKNQGVLGIALFFGMTVVFSAIGMPRQLMSIAAGYAFGVFMGTLLMGLALVGGGLIGFYYMRFLARETVQRRFARKIAAIERVWLTKPFLLTVCLRLLPVGNNALLNLLAGTSRIHPVPFFCGSFVGYIPQNLIFTLLGSGIGFDDTEKFLYSGLLFLVSVSLGIIVYRSLHRQGTDVFLTGDGGSSDSDRLRRTDGVGTVETATNGMDDAGREIGERDSVDSALAEPTFTECAPAESPLGEFPLDKSPSDESPEKSSNESPLVEPSPDEPFSEEFFSNESFPEESFSDDSPLGESSLDGFPVAETDSVGGKTKPAPWQREDRDLHRYVEDRGSQRRLEGLSAERRQAGETDEFENFGTFRNLALFGESEKPDG